ncbi:hypothetical protein CMO92_01345 [Candidatus Woesearchaeota archaeon]|nr:hypothetical protein [Candidatus Woesearchaeota archaeon]
MRALSQTREGIFDRQPDTETETDVSIQKKEAIEELTGNLAKQKDKDALMNSVLENDEESIQEGKVISDSISQGVGSFTPDIMFEKLVTNFKEAKKLYGKTIIRELSGYDPNYIDKNRNIPEFKRQLKSDIENNIKKYQEKKLIDDDYIVTNKGLFLSSLVLYIEELDKLITRGQGEKEIKEKHVYGEKGPIIPFKKGRYRDIALRPSIKLAIRRNHKQLHPSDLKSHERHRTGKINIIYAVDSSGSMKGEKLKVSKKAGIALAFKAIEEKNKVGLIVFEKEVRYTLPPSNNFIEIIQELARVRAGSETDFSKVLHKSRELFPQTKETKHLIFITDALPTAGKDPIQETLKATSQARAAGITVSIIGIKLEEDGLALAQKITDIGAGRLLICKNLDDLDALVLEDYTLTMSE